MIGDTDRILSALREIVRAEITALTFAGLYEYAVDDTRVEGDVVTFDGRPTTSSVVLPPAVRWPIRPGVAGAKFKPHRGAIVYVAFANMDPTRPIVVAFDGHAPSDTQIDSTGTIGIGDGATEIDLGNGAPALVPLGLETGRVVRYGDTLAGPASLGVPLVVAPGIPGAFVSVSKVRA